MTRTNDPPRWAEVLLLRFLRIKDREIIYETLVWTVFEVCVALTGVALMFQGILTLALQFGLFGGFPSPKRVP
jgi:hypothetical protein